MEISLSVVRVIGRASALGFVVACAQQLTCMAIMQVPCGNDKKKDKGKGKDRSRFLRNDNKKSKCKCCDLSTAPSARFACSGSGRDDRVRVHAVDGKAGCLREWRQEGEGQPQRQRQKRIPAE